MYILLFYILSHSFTDVKTIDASQDLKTPLILIINRSSARNLKPILRNTGIFVDFLAKLLDLLSSTSFPVKKLKKYCKVMHRALRYIGYRFTKKLSRHFKDLSLMYGDEIKVVMQKHRRELHKNLLHRTEFLEAMNEVFNLQDNLQFNDYILDVRDYGNEDKLFIHEETSKIINNVILNKIYKLSGKEQNQLEKKLKKAIKEYDGIEYDGYWK